jgi:hypothetical protein
MKLLICIAFHFRQHRLGYLKQVLESYLRLAPQMEIFIMTNTVDPGEIGEIQSVFPERSADQVIHALSFVNLINPWILTWGHKQIMRERFEGHGFTHFIYAEDDIEITPASMSYWLQERENLRPHGFYPSLLRVEWSESAGTWVSTDVLASTSIQKLPTLRVDACDGDYVNLGNPYQACFIYDRDLMAEHMASDTFDVMKYGKIEVQNFAWGGGMAEHANLGITYDKVPAGFISRNLIRYYKKFGVLDPRCYVHHIPNNYASNPDTPHGKVPLHQLLSA